MITLKISASIGNEWAVRDIWAVIPELPEVPYEGGTLKVTPQIAKLIADDCAYMIDPDGPEMTVGEQSAYRALLKQIVSALSVENQVLLGLILDAAHPMLRARFAAWTQRAEKATGETK